MQIQVNTDDNVQGRAALTAWVEKEVTTALGRFREHVTRVEVHLGDENAGKSGGADKRCMMEARPSGQPPLSVTHQAGSLDEACRGAIRKLKGVLDGKFAKMHDRKGSESIRDLVTDAPETSDATDPSGPSGTSDALGTPDRP